NELFTKVELKVPTSRLRAGAAGFGAVNYDIDPDGNVRRARLEYQLEGERFESFVRRLYDLGVRAGLPARPLPAGDAFLINYRGGPRTFPWIPYYRVLDGEGSPEAFSGKIVLVGATPPILHDAFSTPFAPANGMPGVEIHANALDTLFQGIPVRPAPRAAAGAASLAAAVAAVWLTRRLRPLRAFFVLAGVALAGWGLAVGLFVLWHAWAAAVAPTLALVLAYGTTVVVEFVQEQREKRRLSRFFSPAVLREIVRHKDDAHLGRSRHLDPERRRHQHRRGDRGHARLPSAARVHGRRRHGQPGGPPREHHQGLRRPDHHQRVHVGPRGRPVPRARPWRGDGEGQGGAGQDPRRPSVQHAEGRARARRRAGGDHGRSGDRRGGRPRSGRERPVRARAPARADARHVRAAVDRRHGPRRAGR